RRSLPEPDSSLPADVVQDFSPALCRSKDLLYTYKANARVRDGPCIATSQKRTAPLGSAQAGAWHTTCNPRTGCTTGGSRAVQLASYSRDDYGRRDWRRRRVLLFYRTGTGSPAAARAGA